MPLLKIGSKRQVFNGTAEKTSGGLTKRELMTNKNGKVVSIKQHNAGCRNAVNLQDYRHAGKYGQECQIFSPANSGVRMKTVARKSASRKTVARKSASRKPVARRSPTPAVRRSARLASRKAKLSYW